MHGTFLRKFIKRISWQVNFLTFLEIAALIAVYPLMRFAPAAWFAEYGVVETSQLLLLLAGMVVALGSKINKPLFIFAAMLCFFMIMRETNMGRGYFCAQYLAEGQICRWSSFKYGYVPQAIRILYVLFMLYYFCRHKIYRLLWQYIAKAPLYFWDMAVLLSAAVGGSLAECSFIDNEIMEESCELIFYLALFNCIWRYKSIPLKA